jgi:hypothetical protein
LGARPGAVYGEIFDISNLDEKRGIHGEQDARHSFVQVGYGERKLDKSGSSSIPATIEATINTIKIIGAHTTNVRLD